MTATFAEDSYEEERVTVESKMKAALRGLERHKSPRVDGIPMELFQVTEVKSVKIITSICQKNMKNKTMSYRLETFKYTSQFPERRC